MSSARRIRAIVERPMAAARKMRMSDGMYKGAVEGTDLALRLTQIDGSRQLSRRI